LRVYHSGRNPEHRARERALQAAGAEVTLVVPVSWRDSGDEAVLSDEAFPIVELPVIRAGDVNRHAYKERSRLARVIREVGPDILDLHEEPFSAASHQWLSAAPAELGVVMYTAQNVDKRFPPPFSAYERLAYRRISALYPCSNQAASVARGKGFGGLIDVIPLGYDPAVYSEGQQSADDDEVVLGLFGRLVREKGVQDAVRVLAHVTEVRPARLVVVGSGPEEGALRYLAAQLGVGDRVTILPWLPAAELAEVYRRTHIVLIPSVATATWVEQFGRVIVEGQASGAVVAGYASGAVAEVAGTPGVLSPVGDLDHLARNVINLVRGADEYKRRRSEGLALAETRTWTRVARSQTELYTDASRSKVAPRTSLSQAARRRNARREFGPTAATTAGPRPFALPLLRRGGVLPQTLARIIDGTAALRARIVRA
jgi:glycosyltransferase involved in cell wall biosynthesis